jgi:hypothetical protein
VCFLLLLFVTLCKQACLSQVGRESVRACAMMAGANQGSWALACTGKVLGNARVPLRRGSTFPGWSTPHSTLLMDEVRLGTRPNSALLGCII